MAKIRPVYFVQGYTVETGELVTWKYRADTEYKGVLICDSFGVKIAFVNYPENKWIVTDKNTTEVTVFAVGMDDEMVESGRAVLPGTVPMKSHEKLPVRPNICIHSDENGAYFTKDGAKFIVNGFNFIGLSGGGDHSTFEPFEYDKYTTETMLMQMHEMGYNTVRVFVMGGRNDINPGFSGGRDHNDRTFDRKYMDNFLHFMYLCRKYDFYLLPTFGDNEIPGNRYYQTISGGCDRCQVYFNEGAVMAKSIMIEEFLSEIKDEDPDLINTLFAIQFQNEFCFYENMAPFDLCDGIYRLYDGTEYDMANDEARRALAYHALELYYSTLKETVNRIAPDKLICEGTFTMCAVGKDMAAAYGVRSGFSDPRVPMSSVEYLRLPLDFLDIHIYCEDTDNASEAFDKNYRNMLIDSAETKELMKRKPVIMGEFNSFKPDRRNGDFSVAEKTIIGLRDNAMRSGFAGFLVWTVDSFWQPEIWHLMEDGGGFAERLSLLKKSLD